MVASACSPGTWETQVGRVPEFTSSLGYIVHSDHPGLQIETLSELWNLVMDSMHAKLPIAHYELWASPSDHQGFEPLAPPGLTQCLALHGLSVQMLQCNDCLALSTQPSGRWQIASVMMKMFLWPRISLIWYTFIMEVFIAQNQDVSTLGYLTVRLKKQDFWVVWGISGATSRSWDPDACKFLIVVNDVSVETT